MGTFVVTGAASGIGAATTELLRSQGSDVIGVDRAEADVVADLATPAGRRAAIDAIGERCGGVLDGVVPCAGVGPIPDRAGSSIVAVNYFGTVELLAALRPALAAGTAPAVVAISSNSTTTTPGVPDDLVELCLAGDEAAATARADEAGPFAAYPASKLGIARWVRRNAVTDAWAGAGIRLNAVAPGMIETAMVAEGRADPMVGPLMDGFPLPVGRSGRPEEIAKLVTYLLGPDAGFFCGSVVFCDGGTDALLRADAWPAPWDLNVG